MISDSDETSSWSLDIYEETRRNASCAESAEKAVKRLRFKSVRDNPVTVLAMARRTDKGMTSWMGKPFSSFGEYEHNFRE